MFNKQVQNKNDSSLPLLEYQMIQHKLKFANFQSPFHCKLTEVKPIFFTTPEAFRKWLNKHHQDLTELWVGYYKKGSGIPSITWPESVDQALCFGWIDGIRKSIDEQSYKVRFTPRKPNSHWSDVNIKKIKELKKLGLLEPSGLTAYNKRTQKRSRNASYEQQQVKLSNEYQKQFKLNPQAWEYFNQKAKSYQRTAIWWVVSAKKKETQLNRLKTLIESSQNQDIIPPLKWTKKKGK